MPLRDYQQAAVDAFWDYFTECARKDTELAQEKGEPIFVEHNPIIAMPTGTGKSWVIAGIIKSIFDHFRTQKILMATHVKELIEQNFEKLILHWPTAPAGLYSAGLKRKEADADIVFGGIATMANAAERFGHVDILFIDECHRLSPKSGTMYQQLIAKLREVNPYLRVVGLTATKYRMGQGMLTEDGLFTDVCFDITDFHSFNRLVAEGHLCRLSTKRTGFELDTDRVKISGGEFVISDLQKSVDREEITNAALMEAVALGQDRDHWLVFGTGVDHCEHIAYQLNSMGISAATVHSKLKTEDRDARIEAFKRGELRALVNNNVLTTGFDSPWIDLIVVLRPTMSTSLWVQMLGRGTRPFETKTDCLVLDFAKNTQRLGPINDPVLPRKRGKGKAGAAPVKECPHCHHYVHASVRICTECGKEIPVSVKFGIFAGTQEVMKTEQPQIEDFVVDLVTYERHKKRVNDGKPDSIVITYRCGLRRFTNYLCVEHEGYPRQQAERWWKEHDTNDLPLPITVTATLALTKYLRTPKKISVWINKKHPEIKGYEF